MAALKPVLLYQAQDVLLASLQGEYCVKDAVEPTALLLEEEEEGSGLVVLVLVLELEGWGAEEAAVLEVSLPVVPELVPEPEPESEMGSEPVLEPTTCAASFCRYG